MKLFVAVSLNLQYDYTTLHFLGFWAIIAIIKLLLLFPCAWKNYPMFHLCLNSARPLCSKCGVFFCVCE